MERDAKKPKSTVEVRRSEKEAGPLGAPEGGGDRREGVQSNWTPDTATLV